jgi:hypothetical protein
MDFLFKNYRIVEQQNINGNIVFVPQLRKFFIFWFPYMEMSVFPKRVEFETIESARKFLNRQIQKPEEKVYYY